MKLSRRLVSSAVIMMSMYIFSVSPLCLFLKAYINGRREELRMENVRVNGESFDRLRAAVPGLSAAETLLKASSAAESVPEKEEPVMTNFIG